MFRPFELRYFVDDVMNTGNSENRDFLSGFIAIIGPPNVGKSTLLNRLLNTKVAIVSPKPQTTRNRILGIYHGEGYQMAFLDTPGIHRTRTSLHKSMVSSARESLFEVDIIMLVIEMFRPDDPEIPVILRNLKKTAKPVILIINKIDEGPREKLLPIIGSFEKRYPFDSIIPISALKGDGMKRLFTELKVRLKPGPEFFPSDMKTDQSEPFFISEVIREKIFLHMRHELPYSSAVTVDKVKEIPEKNLLSISAVIHVESESQKAMIIGRKGRMIRKVGEASRLELEKLFGIHIFLDLFARVEKNWSKDTRSLRKLGY